ncbi:hypothetical protein DEU56DRAFT_761813 [Suillus clintonianus]|uniref:uncharacterized protein n=1 Tax=Suillus clintonianus TaxID=1904413 RepID=UPI001B880DB9|nr:uncharacterized protein DEU56DRAFT_761813 [Suillus clintonianus]KAG2114538.1 hypothetical protein DEU56DRAFT_761813 [Suillus clintonianus]
MSDPTETQQLWMHLYAVLVANSILVYDHMVTLPEEIAFIWRRPKTRSAMLFLVNRYVALLGNIFGLCINFLPNSDETAVLFFPRNHRLPRGPLDIFQTMQPSCQELAAMKHIQQQCIGLAWVALFIFELIIFILLVYKICKTRGLLRLSLFTRSNVIDIIFHDGAMYFGAMTLVGIPNILTYYVDYFLTIAKVNTRGSLATFTSCMSATLVSRLVLNLHESMDTGILSTTVRDESVSFALLTTRVNVQSAISSHHW